MVKKEQRLKIGEEIVREYLATFYALKSGERPFQTTKGTETDYPTLDCFLLGGGLEDHRWKNGVLVYKKQKNKNDRQ